MRNVTTHEMGDYNLGYFDGKTDRLDNVVSDEFLRLNSQDIRITILLHNSPDYHYFWGYTDAINNIPPKIFNLNNR